jgi:hypothetical protein
MSTPYSDECTNLVDDKETCQEQKQLKYTFDAINYIIEKHNDIIKKNIKKKIAKADELMNLQNYITIDSSNKYTIASTAPWRILIEDTIFFLLTSGHQDPCIKLNSAIILLFVMIESNDNAMFTELANMLFNYLLGKFSKSERQQIDQPKLISFFTQPKNNKCNKNQHLINGFFIDLINDIYRSDEKKVDISPQVVDEVGSVDDESYTDENEFNLTKEEEAQFEIGGGRRKKQNRTKRQKGKTLRRKKSRKINRKTKRKIKVKRTRRIKKIRR